MPLCVSLCFVSFDVINLWKKEVYREREPYLSRMAGSSYIDPNRLPTCSSFVVEFRPDSERTLSERFDGGLSAPPRLHARRCSAQQQRFDLEEAEAVSQLPFVADS